MTMPIKRSLTFSSYQSPANQLTPLWPNGAAGQTSPPSTSPKLEIDANPMDTVLIKSWINALQAFDRNKIHEALDAFIDIEPKNSKINYNIGSLYATLGQHDAAIIHYKLAIENDKYMAIAYFQVGVSRFLTGMYRKAASAFNNALKLMRGNSVVNYQQLGLAYRLYSCEVMYNRALSYIYAGELKVGVYDLGFAIKEKKYIKEHVIVDEALRHFRYEQKESDEPDDHVLKVPGKPMADIRHQRFSTLGPPKAEYFTPKTESLADDDQTGKKEMVYSLFSVPQGALFRLTETKVQSILNDKHIGAVIMGMPYPQPALIEEEEEPEEEALAEAANAQDQQPVPPPPRLYQQKEVKPLLLKDSIPKTRNRRMPSVPSLSSSGGTSSSTYVEDTDNLELSPVYTSSQTEPSLSPESMRLKIKYDDETRTTMLPLPATLASFRNRVITKLELEIDDGDVLNMRIRDDDGDMILLRDEEDLEVAIRDSNKKKLSIHCQLVRQHKSHNVNNPWRQEE